MRSAGPKRRMSFEQLQLGLPGTDECPNEPNAESTLWCPGARLLVLQVAKNTAVIEMGRMSQGPTAGLGGVVWLPPEIFLPCLLWIPQDFDAIRASNLTAGSEAQVLISVRT